MASGERRLGSARRGMTVLGKIPTPSVPKPINLPSQRLENRGLEPNVDLVPRGTFTWGGPGRSSTVGVGKEEGSGIPSSPPITAVAWNDPFKIQGLSASSNESAGSSSESYGPSSAGNDARPSSAPTGATSRGWCNAKTKVEVPVQLSGVTENSEEPVTLKSQGKADLTPQHKNVLSNWPTSADGTVMETNMRPHSGVTAHASTGPSPAGPGPEGFQHLGDYNGPRPFTWQGMPPAGRHELRGRSGPYSGPLPHELYFSPFSVPQYGNMPQGDMVVARMVNGSGVNGSFPSHHLRPAVCFGPPGVYGGYRSTTRPGEQFPLLANSAMGASSSTPGMSIGFFPDGHPYSLQEGDGQFGAVSMNGGFPGLQRDADIHSLSTHVSGRNHRMPRTFGRQNYASGEHGNVAKEGVTPMMEKKITLLTKVRVDAPTTATISNDSTLVLDMNQGKEVCQLETKTSTDADKSESTQSSNLGFDIKGFTKANKLLESKKSDDSGAAKIITQAVAFAKTEGEIQQDVVAMNIGKDYRSEIQAGVVKSFSPPTSKTWRKTAGRNAVNASSSAQRLLTSTSIENIEDSALKGQIDDCLKSEVDEHGIKASRQTHEGSPSSAISELGFSQKCSTTIYIDNQSCLAIAKNPVGIDSEAVCSETPKPSVLEDVLCRVDSKAKTKPLNHRTEKEWRPKSPVVESKAPGFRSRKAGKRGEQLCNADSVKELSFQECSTESVVLETSSLCQTQKANSKRLFRNVERFSWSANSLPNSSKEARFPLTDESSRAHSGVYEGTSDQPFQRKSEGAFETEALSFGDHSSARSADQVLQTDYFKAMATEGLVLKGDHKAKLKQSNHKREKEWRPKSPAVESAAFCDNLSASQDSEAKATLASLSDADIKNTPDLNVSEQEASQPPDAYDYDGQRAKLKEIAAQRAKQRRKEEEDRIKEQKAKALAKLEELNRRTLATTSAEMAEHGSVVSVDEAPSKKIKKKFNSSRHSYVDVPVHESSTLAEQHVDGNMVWAPVRNSTSTTFDAQHIAEVGEELPSNDALPQPSNSAEKHQTQKWLPAAGSSEEIRQQSRKERTIREEDLPSVNDTQAELSSKKKFGVEIRKGDSVKLAWLQGGRQQMADYSQNQGGKGASTYRIERKGSLEEQREVEQPYPSSLLSQTSDFRDKGEIFGKAASRRGRQTTVEVQKQSNAGEPSVLEGQSFAINSPMMPIHSQKSHKSKNAGKDYRACRHQEGQIPVEVRDLHAVEERKTAVSGSGKSEFTEQNATVSKNEVEAKATENVKTGRSLNSRRQKSVNGSYMLKQASMKEMNYRHPESLAATEAGFGDIADPSHLHALSNNIPHNPPPHTNQSFKALGAPPGHRHRPMKVSNTTSSQISLEEHTLVQINSVTRHPRSTGASRQDWESEDSEYLAGHSRKHGSQVQAEPTLNFEGDVQHLNHQSFYSGNAADTISDQHVPASTSKTRSYHAHTENRKINRQQHAGSQAFRPREQHHEAESEIRYNRGEQRSSRGRNKPSRDGQVNGCSLTFAELDRRGAESAITTEISY